MLQQTRPRVEPISAFIAEFPDFQMLAQQSLRDVLDVQAWGINRRENSYIKTLSAYDDFGKLPMIQVVGDLPRIGKNTAVQSHIAFNKPNLFIETNIRTVFPFFLRSGSGAR